MLSVASLDSTFLLKQYGKSSENEQTLNRYALLDPEAQASSDKCYKILWKTLAIVSFVAFIALALIATIWTGLEAPIYLPVATIAILTLFLPIAYKVYRFFDNKSEAYARSEKIEAGVCEKLEAISFEKFTERFRELNISLSSFSSTDLKPLLARFEFFEERRKDVESEIEKIQKKMKDPSKEEKMQKYQFNLLVMKEMAELIKIHAAYFLGVLKNPSDQRELTDLAKFAHDKPFPDKEMIFSRLLRHKFQDESADVLIQFQGDEKGTTIEELQRMTPSDIADRLFTKESA